MDDLLKKLATEPLDIPGRAMEKAQRLAAGPRLVKRRAGPVEAVVSLPKLTKAELKEREAEHLESKISALLDYYATTDLSAEHVASLLGIYRSEERPGTNEDGEPETIRVKVLDIERVEAMLKWRRDHAE